MIVLFRPLCQGFTLRGLEIFELLSLFLLPNSKIFLQNILAMDANCVCLFSTSFVVLHFPGELSTCAVLKVL